MRWINFGFLIIYSNFAVQARASYIIIIILLLFSASIDYKMWAGCNHANGAASGTHPFLLVYVFVYLRRFVFFYINYTLRMRGNKRTKGKRERERWKNTLYSFSIYYNLDVCALKLRDMPKKKNIGKKKAHKRGVRMCAQFSNLFYSNVAHGAIFENLLFLL